LHTSCLLVSCLVTEWPPVACKLYPSGRQSHANNARVAANRMKNFGRFNSCCLRLAATRVQFTCHGGYSGRICMRLAASRMQTLHALVASCMQSRQFFASTLREQLFELKNEDAMKKSENLRDTCTSCTNDCFDLCQISDIRIRNLPVSSTPAKSSRTKLHITGRQILKNI
jgi:hypothetical protein